MIHAYNEIYLSNVMKNLAALFDLAINAEGFDNDEFAKKFAQSDIASGKGKWESNIPWTISISE